MELDFHIFDDFLRRVGRVDELFDKGYRAQQIFQHLEDFASGDGLKLTELKQQSYIMRV